MELIKKYIQRFKSYFSYNFKFLKVFFSPFKPLTTKWYFGEIEHGTPYFLPRKWVKCNMDDALKAWGKLSEETRKHTLLSKERNYERWLENYTKSYTKAIPIKYFGWDFTSLGWKTKWDEYRFEWSPSLSIVLFGKQLFIVFIPKNMDIQYVHSYWEGWLTWEYDTNKKLSKEERFKELCTKFSCTWIGSGVSKDHYEEILRNNYLKLYKKDKNESI